jgi:hypothetical protein
MWLFERADGHVGSGVRACVSDLVETQGKQVRAATLASITEPDVGVHKNGTTSRSGGPPYRHIRLAWSQPSSCCEERWQFEVDKD